MKVCLVLSVLSLVFIFIIPSYGKMTYVFPGAWQGVFIHKNVLGRFAVFAFGLSLVVWSQDRDRASMTGCLMALLLAVGCGSATAFIGALLMILTFLGTRRLAMLKLSFVATLVLAFMLWSFFDIIVIWLAETFDKSVTLSGRIPLWEAVLIAISDKPLLGYGMGGFWEGVAAEGIREDMNWFVPHAHNGILELALQVGWVGVFLLVYITVVVIRYGFLMMAKYSGRYKEWPLVFCVFFILYGFGEANYMRPNSFVHFYIISIYCMLVRFHARGWEVAKV